VIGRRLAPADLLQEAAPDVVTLFDAEAAISAVRSGTIDASFRVITLPARQLPGASRRPASTTSPSDSSPAPARTPRHPRRHPPAAVHRIWMPGNVAGTEWAASRVACARVRLVHP